MTPSTRQLPFVASAAAALALFCGSALSAENAAAARNDSVGAMALYGQGAAVVEDSRSLDLKKGAQRLSWPVSGHLQADTLWLSGQGVQLTGFSTSGAGRSANSLSSRIGQPVTLVSPSGKMAQGTLVNVDGDTAYLRIDKRIERVTAGSPIQLSWPAPGASPGGNENSGLKLNVKAERAGSHKLTATYQIAAPSWQASYTGRFDPKTGKLALQSTAVIDNSGGQTALDADKAWLVAGDVSRGGDNNRPQPLAMKTRMSDAAGAPKASGDTYRYVLKNGLHVPAGSTLAIALMSPKSFQARQHYRFDTYALSNSDQRVHAATYLQFKNTHDAPLPAGTVRIYNAGGTADLMGAADIDDTPAGAPISLTLGHSFDVTATHQVMKPSQPVNKNTRKRIVRITAFNASNQPARVSLVENLPSDASILSASQKRDEQAYAGDTAMWQLRVPANGQSELRYTLQWPVR